MTHDGFRGAGKTTIEMTVIGSEDDPIIPNHVNDMGELFLIGLAGEIELAALQEFARLSFQRGQLHAEHFIMLVHSV